MKKPGRPRKNGQKPMWMLMRDTLAIYAYGLARDVGEKHIVAILEAVKHIRDSCPRMPISETEVNRILVAWRSRQRATCLFVSKPDPERSIIQVPGRDGRIIYARIVYTASVGSHPSLPSREPSQRA
ncbi:MAG: hypothetical protein WB799_00110 [Candidatus Sulfotelmatobacter sp.]